MKVKTQKAVKKTLRLFQTYGLREPYQVLLDGDFVQMMASQGVLDISKRLEGTFHGRVKPMISQCSIEHLYARGEAGQKATILARTLERRKCNHWEAKADEDECIAGLIGENNNLHYAVVTQSAPLRERLRQVPGTPLLYINARSVLLLEAPSEATVSGRKQLEDEKRHAPAEDLEAVQASTSTNITGLPSAAKSQPGRHTVEHKISLSKRKRPSNPNPLSVKKKQKRPTGTTKETLPLRHEKKRKADDAAGEAEAPAARKKRKRGKKKAPAADGETAVA